MAILKYDTSSVKEDISRLYSKQTSLLMNFRYLQPASPPNQVFAGQLHHEVGHSALIPSQQKGSRS